MSLFDKDENKESNVFPTEPAFLVPVQVRDTPDYGKGHKGVFADASIAAGTKFWMWTDRVQQIHRDDLDGYIKENFSDKEQIRTFLRQGFVLPNKPDFFNSNPTDAGRFMNHSCDPNCGPDGTIRAIQTGEELTMDYGFHGDPQWYQILCQKYGVDTEAQIAAKARAKEMPTTRRS